MPGEAVRDAAVRWTGQRVWFGFPHWIVLGWAALISYNVYELLDWRTDFEASRALIVSENAESLTALSNAVAALQRSTTELRDESIRVKTILSLEFPETARKVDRAIDKEAR